MSGKNIRLAADLFIIIIVYSVFVVLGILSHKIN